MTNWWLPHAWSEPTVAPEPDGAIVRPKSDIVKVVTLLSSPCTTISSWKAFIAFEMIP